MLYQSQYHFVLYNHDYCICHLHTTQVVCTNILISVYGMNDMPVGLQIQCPPGQSTVSELALVNVT